MSRRFAFASLFLVACGGAAAPAPGRAPEAQAPDPSSVEEAQQQIAQAKADLTTRAEAAKEPSTVSPGGAGAGATADEAPKKSSSSVEADHAVTSPACQSPCRAIASMRRAVGALCRMTGDADARCSEAKRTLKESELRVSSCGC